MITLDQLEKLVAFADCGTLQKAATKLAITQPTITRSLKQLESTLGVALFVRTPNKITLTKAGKLAVTKAKQVLAASQDFTTTVQNYAVNHPINASSTSPAALWFFSQSNPAAAITPAKKLISDADISPLLKRYQSDVIFSTHDVNDEIIESRFIGVEQLYIKLPINSPLAARKHLNFADLTQEHILIYDNIGVWKSIVERHIPQSQLMYQLNRSSFNALNQSTDFPVFRSNITMCNYHEYCDDRPAIIIDDAAAKIAIYANYRRADRNFITPLLLQMASNWTAISQQSAAQIKSSS